MIEPIKYQYKDYQIKVEQKDYGFNSTISRGHFSRFIVVGGSSLEICKQLTEARVDYLTELQKIKDEE